MREADVVLLTGKVGDLVIGDLGSISSTCLRAAFTCTDPKVQKAA